MALATQCPFCQTTFRVVQDQLKLRGGLVRCGNCKEVFNGNDYLVAQQLVVSPVPVEPLAPPPAVPASAWPPLPNHNAPNTAPNLTSAPGAPAPPATPTWLAPANLSATFASIAAETSDAPWGAAATSSTNPAATKTTAENSAPPRADEAPAPEAVSINTLTQELSFPLPQTSSAPQEDDSQTGADAAALDQALNELAADTDDHAPSGSLKQPTRDDNTPPVATGQPDVPHAEPLDAASESWAITPPEHEAENEYDHGGLTEDDEHGDDEDESDAPGFVQRAERSARRRRILGILVAVGTVLLSITLLLQALYLWRNQVAAWLPSTRPLLSAVCARLHCTVGLPTNIEQLSLESNELQLVPPNQNIYTLTVLLRNRGASAQAWPYMELTLNDNDEKPITRRVFTPREYLPAMPQINAGFAGNSEQQVKLTFELSQPVASGYRIYLFFP
jgi:predicted Zn finger-like uncharacterized protein